MTAEPSKSAIDPDEPAPQIAEARPPCGEPYNCICPTGPDFQTPMVWGKAATCADAFQNAVNQTRALMNCEYGVCSETFVVTTGCWFNGTQQQVDGYSLYRCYDCMVDPCEEEIPVI